MTAVLVVISIYASEVWQRMDVKVCVPWNACYRNRRKCWSAANIEVLQRRENYVLSKLKVIRMKKMRDSMRAVNSFDRCTANSTPNNLHINRIFHRIQPEIPTSAAGNPTSVLYAAGRYGRAGEYQKKTRRQKEATVPICL